MISADTAVQICEVKTMNKRQAKKRVKKKYNLVRYPNGMIPRWADRFFGAIEESIKLAIKNGKSFGEWYEELIDMLEEENDDNG